jgi:hypothetical protein
MKKIISMLLVVSLCCGMIVGCGGKPSDVSQEVYDLGVETCDVLDDYIQGKMKRETCEDMLDDIANRAEELDKNEDNTSTDDLILTEIRLSPFSVSSLSINEGETYKAEAAMEELKEQLNL